MNSPSENSTFSKSSVGLLLFIAFSLAIFLHTQFPDLVDRELIAGNIGLFVLINLNVVFILILGFLIAKNVFKLLLDRQRKILGSKLKARLVFAFVGLSLVPALLLFFTAKGILERVMKGWFAPQVESAVEGSLEVATSYYESLEQRDREGAETIVSSLENLLPLLFYTNPNEAPTESDSFILGEKRRTLLENFLEQRGQAFGFEQLSIITPKGSLVATYQQKLRPSVSSEGITERIFYPQFNRVAIKEAILGSKRIQAENSYQEEFLRGYLPISFQLSPSQNNDKPEEGNVNFVLVHTNWISPEVSSLINKIVLAYDDYRELRQFNRPLRSNYFLTLAIVLLLIVFAAIWIGFFLAKSLTGPIKELAEGTIQVSSGNLGYRIPEVSDDELGILVESFNTMTSDLERARDELIERRIYIETVISSIGVGVVSYNSAGVIQMWNQAANDIFLDNSETKSKTSFNGQSKLGSDFREAFPKLIVDTIEQLEKELKTGIQSMASTPIVLSSSSGAKHLHITLTDLKSAGLLSARNLDADDGEDLPLDSLGRVILIDDFSELNKAQRMAAWREVARRIAHEIKNPLTPIQLSAQRLRRKFLQNSNSGLGGYDLSLVEESTDVIIKQVELMRNLVSEFSKFARMPKIKLELGDIIEVLEKTKKMYQASHPHISFITDLDDEVPKFLFDSEQLSRVIVNLIDNSIYSLEQKAVSASESFRPEITLKAQLSDNLQAVCFEVIDNGLGLETDQVEKFFQPYFTTKPGGTGLGLSIVNSIVRDHGGFIRLHTEAKEGLRVRVEFPIKGHDSFGMASVAY